MEQHEIDHISELVDDIRDGMMHAWEQSGWLQYKLGSDETGFCMMGAFYRATMHDRCLTPVWRKAVGETIRDLFPGRPSSIMSFNDAKFTSREDVELCAKHAFERMKVLITDAILEAEKQENAA
jgi:hypothetical protein